MIVRIDDAAVLKSIPQNYMLHGEIISVCIYPDIPYTLKTPVYTLFPHALHAAV